MNALRDTSTGHGAGRAIVVIALSFAVVCVGLLASLPFAGSTGAAVAEPTGPTAAPPTQPGTVAPTAPQTDPPQTVDSSPSSSEVPGTSSPATSRPQNASSNGSGDQWQGSSGTISSRASESNAVADEPVVTTTPPMTTTEDLLVGPTTTRPAATTVAPRDVTGSSVARTGGASDPKIWAIVAALTLVAVALAVATVLYWRRTRPTGESGAGDPGGTGRGSKSRKRSRYADLVVSSPEPQ